MGGGGWGYLLPYTCSLMSMWCLIFVEFLMSFFVDAYVVSNLYIYIYFLNVLCRAVLFGYCRVNMSISYVCHCVICIRNVCPTHQ